MKKFEFTINLYTRSKLAVNANFFRKSGILNILTNFFIIKFYINITFPPAFGKAYGYGHALKGQAIGHFAKRYPKTQFGIQAGKVAGIGALGAWILNDDDKKA